MLILLYENAGELRVLLTTRSKSLRAHPGQTALPGGKKDETDVDAVFKLAIDHVREVDLHAVGRESNVEQRGVAIRRLDGHKGTPPCRVVGA